MSNQFGLSRNIPDPVKRTVRQRCGFGCIFCAGSLVDYEHFDPEFAKAREHRAEGITLLCPTCHAKKTRNLLSDRFLREANADPAAKKLRRAFSDVEGTATRPFIKLAGVTLRNCKTLLQVRGLPVFKVEDAEAAGGPYRLTALFFGPGGQPTLFIRQNEWTVFADSWDAEVVGPSVTVRTGPGEVVLRLVFVPGEGLVVEKLQMHCGGYVLKGNQNRLEVQTPNGSRQVFERCIVDNCEVGFSVG